MCTTTNMDQRKQRRELSEDITKKITDKHVQIIGFKTKQLNVAVMTVANNVNKFKFHEVIIVKLPGCKKRKIHPRLNRMVVMADKETTKTSKCNGKKVCELNKSIFPTDPCSDTFKYLETTYICIPATHLITCEHSMAHLKCGDGLVISVLGADFGRRDETTCSFKKPKEQITNVSCSNPTKKVAERCNLKENCTMRASSSVFEDSCVDTYKYLEVSYVCVNPPS